MPGAHGTLGTCVAGGRTQEPRSEGKGQLMQGREASDDDVSSHYRV